MIALPIRRGKLEAWIRFTQALMGRRRAEYEASRRRLGIRRECFSLVQPHLTPVAVVTLEIEEPQRLWTWLADAERPFARWFRRRLQELHGIDLGRPDVRPEQFAVWVDPGAS